MERQGEKHARRWTGLAATLTCALVLAIPASVLAATITPNSVEDDFLNDGNCELREAVIAANTDGVFQGCTATGGMAVDEGPDTIMLANGATYKREIADGGVDEDASANGDLDIVDAPAGQEEDLTITGPLPGGATIRGGVIAAFGRVLHVVSTDAILTLNRVEIESGRSLTATGGGGGILNLGTVNLTESTVTLNHSESSGGGVENAGIFNAINSTIQGNTAWESGAGLDNFLSTATLSNVTVAHNQANTNAATDPDGVGGGIREFGGTIQLRNSIVADNSQAFLAFPGTAPDCSGSPTSLGYNLIGSTAGCTWVNNNDVLNPAGSGLAFGLAENGGPTRTVALLAGSPARDAGNPLAPAADVSTGACALADQRGVARGGTMGRCDIGAFEATPIASSSGSGGGGGGLGACDGKNATVASASATISGTAGNDTITGTAGNDVITGAAGNDTIRGLGGKDVICGDEGRDTLIGGGGNDRLLGGAGKDKLKGGGARDTCIGAGARDTATACEKAKSI